MQNLAEVRLWGNLVGALAYPQDSDTNSGATNLLSTFEFAPEWLASDCEIAPLHMPLNRRKYQFPGLNPATYRGLPAVFADTLPDDFGNAVIDAWLARNGRDANSFSAIERLLYSGNRGMGALEFEPAINKNNSPQQQIELNSLVEMAQQIIDQRSELNQSVNEANNKENNSLGALFQVGTSAGGARAKALIAINKQRTEIRSGQIEAPEDFEHYLLKFDGIEEQQSGSEIFGDPKGFGRMEYAYYLMAKDAGINIQESELLIHNDLAHFMTKRFDRAEEKTDMGNIHQNRKIHYASLCAMDHADYKQPGAYSYEQLLTVARQLRLPRADAIEIYRRMVFNVVARNHDDHTKNIGFILESPTSRWRLAPAFDLAYSYKADSPWVNSHQMSLNGKRDQFKREDILSLGSLLGNFKKEAQQILHDTIVVVKNWKEYADKADVFDGLKREIAKNHRTDL